MPPPKGEAAGILAGLVELVVTLLGAVAGWAFLLWMAGDVLGPFWAAFAAVAFVVWLRRKRRTEAEEIRRMFDEQRRDR